MINIIVNGSLRGKNFNNSKAILHKGRPLADIPKTYKLIGMLNHNLGNNYNPSTLTVYQAKNKIYRYEIYRSGCFYPYYGKIKFIQEEK